METFKYNILKTDIEFRGKALYWYNKPVYIMDAERLNNSNTGNPKIKIKVIPLSTFGNLMFPVNDKEAFPMFQAFIKEMSDLTFDLTSASNAGFVYGLDYVFPRNYIGKLMLVDYHYTKGLKGILDDMRHAEHTTDLI